MPVTAVPMPSASSATKAMVCSRRTSSRNTTAKARKPGTSRRLCRMPISMPVKPACSIAKLLISACQLANDRGTAAANR